ncbi:unnamed protein product, partial [Mesorhabditis spiculigera]
MLKLLALAAVIGITSAALGDGCNKCKVDHINMDHDQLRFKTLLHEADGCVRGVPTCFSGDWIMYNNKEWVKGDLTLFCQNNQWFHKTTKVTKLACRDYPKK